MKKILLLSISMLFLLVLNASAASVIMEGNYVKTAISDNGTLGFGSTTSPGLLHDPTGTGSFGIDDYLTPGTPWEMFSVRSAQTGLLVNNNTSPTSGFMAGTVTENADRDVTWTGSRAGMFDISHHYTFNAGDERVSIVTTITATRDLTGMSFARAIDPDPDVRTYGSYYTVNGRGTASIAAEDWVHSEGTSTGLTLGLYSDSDTEHDTGVSSGWSTDPLFYLAGTDNGNGDYTIGIGFDIGDLADGESIVLEYAYVMGDSLDTVDIPGVDPVPEPATMLLFGIGLLGLAGINRRKK